MAWYAVLSRTTSAAALLLFYFVAGGGRGCAAATALGTALSVGGGAAAAAGDGAAISRALSRLLSTPVVRERCEELRALSEDDGETGCQRGAWHILDWAAKRAQSAPAVAADA